MEGGEPGNDVLGLASTLANSTKPMITYYRVAPEYQPRPWRLSAKTLVFPP